jgi:NAD(P)-dependent dehydrogenase (short-subunit alcohol dehydrogenase family)
LRNKHPEERSVRLKNKIGIVTAAASGMGRAGALLFAREGAAVGVVDIDRAGVEAVVAEITAAGGRAHPIVADLTRDEDSRHIVKETAKISAGSTSSGITSAIRDPLRSKAST